MARPGTVMRCRPDPLPALRRKLTLRYSGMKHQIPRYSCSCGWMDNGEARCIAFGGLRVDDAIEEALLCGWAPAPSPRRRQPRGKPQNDGIRFARLLAVTSKKGATPPTAPSISMMRPIRPTGWWLANSRRALEPGARPRCRGGEQDRRA